MKRDKGTGFVAVFVALLLAVTMFPATGVQSAFADEQFVVDGLVYKAVDGGAVLVGFEDGGALEDNVTVPEKVTGGSGELTVTGVDVAEGQSAPNVKALALPQTVENVNTKSLAAAMPGLAAVNVDGTAGEYSSANGLLFRQADEAASSDGSTVKVANRELLWTPPATVIARIPGTCKRVASGAFTDAKALETIMAFSTVESIARPEKDSEGNITKEGAFTDEQVSRVNIVIPISATVQPEGEDRISTDVFLSEQVGLDVKQTPWCDYGFDIKRFTVGIPCGSTSVTVAVPEDGVVETPVITVGDYVGYLQWNPKPGEVDWPDDGLVFEYKADMTVSVGWDGNKEAIPAHLELPAYVVENGVKTAVTEIAPNAFENAAQLEGITIPEGVTTIGESAFAGCSGLKSVSLPSTLKTIDYAAFKGAGLESIAIPSGVCTVGGEAFAECASLASAQVDGGPFMSSSSFDGTSVAEPVSETQVDDSSNVSSYASGSLKVPLVGKFMNFSIHYRGVVAGDPQADYPYSMFTESTPGKLLPADGVLSTPVNHIHMHVCGTSQQAVIWGSEHETVTAATDLAPTDSYTSFCAFDGDTPIHTPIYWYPGYAAPSWVGWTNNDNGLYSLGGDLLILFDSAGGPEYEPQSYMCNASNRTYQSLPKPTRAGYVFEGWKLDGGTVTESSQIPAAGVYTLVADWEVAPIEATVSAEGAPGAAVTLDTAGGTFGDKATLGSDGKLSIAADAWGAGEQPRVWAKAESNGDLKFYTANAAAPGNLGCTLKAASVSSYHPSKWVIDGADVTPDSGLVELDNESIHAFKLVYAANTYTVTYNVGGGGWVSDASNVDEYTYGAGCELRGADRVKDAPGFWFAGWQPVAEGSGSSLGSSVADGSVTATRIAADAHGDITVYAVWKPITYKINFVTSAAGYKKQPQTDDNLVIAKPNGGSQVFVHPTAYDAIAKVSDPQYGRVDAANHLDLTPVAEGMCGSEGYVFAEPDELLGYDWKGWTGKANAALDDKDAAAYYSIRNNGATDGGQFPTFFDGGWNTPARESVPEAFAYSLWHSVGTSTVTLGSGIRVDAAGAAISGVEQYKNNVGELLVASPDKKLETGSPSVRWWPGRGLVGTDPAAVGPGEPSEQTGTLTPVRRGESKTGEDGSVAYTGKGARLDAQMGLKAPVRYGFQFLGWGTDSDDAAALYVKYEENYAGEGSKFSLTDKGSALVNKWEAAWESAGDDADARADVLEAATQEWVACWAIRTVDVTLRIPAHAVSDVDVTGESTGAGRDAVEDGKPLHPGATTADYSDDEDAYAWREGTAGETGGGATSGWLIAKRTWRYGDVLEHPAFKTQQDRYTYDGWYHIQKPSVTDSTDKALEDLAGTGADLTKVATYQALSAPSKVVVTGGYSVPESGGDPVFATDAGIDVGDAYFTVGDPAAKNASNKGAAVELWLWTSPIRINVASPMGVYLCTTNSYGQAVEPYVVGNDRRTQLEAQAEFSVSTSSHDLQLVDVTAEDIQSYSYEKQDDGSVVVDSASVVSQAGVSGRCDQILDPKPEFAGSVDNLRYDDEGSRMFWVSPVPTATADQTGVVYGSAGSTAAAEAAKAKDPASGEPVAARMTESEKLLVPDVSKRRYFGFGTKDADGNADNRISDQLESEYDKEAAYELGDFVLRKNYVAGKTDGLAKTDVDGMATYRFYYGLDMRRADFNLKGLQQLITDSEGLIGYNSAFDMPLLRVKFTFAAARNPGISYYSAVLVDDGVAAAANAYDAAAEAVDDRIDEATEITVGAPGALG